MDFKKEDHQSDDKTFHNMTEALANNFIRVNVTSSIKYETDIKKESEEQILVSSVDSPKDKDFLAKNPTMKVGECSSCQEMDNKMEFKEEPWWLETETSEEKHVYEDIQDCDSPPAKSSRLYMKVGYDKSPLSSTEMPGRDTSFDIGNIHPECGSLEGAVVKEHVQSEQSGNYSDMEIYSRALQSKKINCNPNSNRPYICDICKKSFMRVSHLKQHKIIHEKEKQHMCKTCGKRFTRLFTLKIHSLIHEGKKPYQCTTCNATFAYLSSLKRHNLIHEGKKQYQCKTCNKSFTWLSTLQRHNLSHEGKKPFQCKTCNKSYSRLDNLKSHTFVHEGKKPYECSTCNKSFSWLSCLKKHNFIHKVKKPHE